MRNLLLFVFSVGAVACTARAPQTTFPREYVCGEGGAFVPHGDRVEIREQSAWTAGGASASAKLGWRDDSGAHYVVGPQSPVDVSALEYIVPSDGEGDATRRTYDTSNGTSRADWRLVSNEVCTARGSDSDVLARYAKGETLDELTHNLSLADRDEAREIVHRAMIKLQKRYFHDR
jgi:hypothetical protein